MAVAELNRDVVEGMPAEGAVVMVNLVKLRERASDGEGSGWDAYQRYSRAVIGMIRERGGTILWSGRAHGTSFGPQEGGDWDFVVLVEYPSKAAFLDMMSSEAYATMANPHRLAGVERHVILAATEEYSKVRR
ncbi:DUF1330 domain-containing protein [Acuticoccus sp.]|uniref:DUF1330 domain-containing protein n=1 Tax=Acuticoccus sp. TaxID=1904378 RepID=UPI003B52177E